MEDMKQIPCQAKLHLMHSCVREVHSKIMCSVTSVSYIILRQRSIFSLFSLCLSADLFCTYVLLLHLDI